MAAVFRAAASAGNNQSSAVSSLGISIPAGAQVGDIAVLTAELLDTASAITTPSGWTLVTGPDTPGGGTNGESYVYLRTLTSGQPGSTVTLPITGGATRALAGMLVFDGVTSTGMDEEHTTEATSTTTLSVPTIPDVPGGSAVICVLSRRRGGTVAPTLTLPGGFTTGFDIKTNYGSIPELALKAGYQVPSTTGDQGGSTGSSSLLTVGVNYLIVLPPSFSDTGMEVYAVNSSGTLVRYSAYYVNASGTLVQVSDKAS